MAEFRRVDVAQDRDNLIELLCNDDWPFHGRRRVTSDDLDSMEFDSPDVASYWIVVETKPVGLVRLLDLGDIGTGAPEFDLRIATRHRRRGIGTLATKWIVQHLFTSYPQLHRIEANTRDDNVGMQRALTTAGFLREGQLRDAWITEDGTWRESLVYGILRRDWDGAAAAP